MSSNLGNRNEHSYLCLVAIYAIHLFVFHVYSSPEIHTIRRKVSSRLRETSDVWITSSHVENATTTTEGLGHREDVEEESIVGRIAKHNETSDHDRFTVEEYRCELRTRGDKIGDDLVSSCIGETVRWTFPKYARFDLVGKWVLSSVASSGTSTTVLTPATWGVLLGCLVFLFTYKERERSDTVVT